MKLIPASSPGMAAAHSHIYVRTTVNILMQDRNLLKPTAKFLKKYFSEEQPGFIESLDALKMNRSRPDASGMVSPPGHVIELTQTLLKIYRQRDKKSIDYQRGAIVESLICKLVGYRYRKPDEFCLTNQRFVENYKDITVKEVDVAAISFPQRKLEGYECKISPAGFEPYDRINLGDLVNAANERQYHVNVGFVAFENDNVMKIKLTNMQLPEFIKLYGLDSLESLEHLFF